MNKNPLLQLEIVGKTYVRHGFRSLLRLQPPLEVAALRGVSFSLHAGEVTALLGPNGAGKTTLINILCDLTRSDYGSIRINDLSLPNQAREARRHIGYASTNDRSFFWRLTGRSNLEFFAALQGFGRAQARAKAAEMLDRFNLASHADRLFHTYSAGMKKRLGLARAFLHDPSVLLLDEPTSGLDAKSTEELLDMVRSEIRGSDKTVLWATHREDEIERLCDRVIVMVSGQVRFDGRTTEFLDISRRHRAFSIEAVAPTGRDAEFTAAMKSMELRLEAMQPDNVVVLSGSGDEERLSAVLGAMIAAGGLVRQVQRLAEPLHKVFAHLEETSAVQAGSPKDPGHPPRPNPWPTRTDRVS